MPRQNNTRPVGTPAPDVGQFGSAEVNLQNPVFRAQTNVDAGENPFEYLQKILGTAGSVASAFIDNQTVKIKGEMARISMEEQKEREARYEERQATAEAKAEEREAKAEEREARIEKERRQRQEAAAWSSKHETNLAILASNNDLPGIDAHRKTLIDARKEIEDGDNPFMRDAYSTLLERTNSSYSTVDNRIDADNNDLERAASEAAIEGAVESSDGIGEDLLTDVDVVERLKYAKPSSAKNAIEDHVIRKMTEKNPAFMKTVFSDGSDVEKKAVNRVIRQEVDKTYNTIFNQRLQEDRLMTSNQRMLGNVSLAREDVGKAFQGLEEEYSRGRITQDSLERGRSMATKAYISEGATPQERSTRAMQIMLEHGDKPSTQSAANVELGKALRQIKSEVDIERRDVFESPDNLVEMDPQGVEVGWKRRFDSQQELIDWFYATKMGIDPKDRDNPMYAGLKSVEADLLKEYDVDHTATESNLRRMNASLNRKPTIKSQKMANDGYEASPLKQVLDTRAFVEMPQDQIDSLMVGETGYMGNAPPDDLMRFVGSNAKDPQAFRLVSSFFAFFPPSNPVVSTRIADDSNLKDAWVQSVLYREVIRGSQGDEAGARAEMTRKMSAYAAFRSQEVAGSIPKTVKDANEKAVMDGLATLYGKEPATKIPFDDMLQLRSLADLHIATGGDPSKAAEFAKKVMTRDLGYTEVPIVRDGKSSVDLVYNPVKSYITAQGRESYRVLPEKSVLSGSEWKAYLDAHKPAAAEYIATLPQFGGRAGPDDTGVASIEISTDPIEMESGGCSVVATSKTGVRYRIPTDRISISHYNFNRWFNTTAGQAAAEAERNPLNSSTRPTRAGLLPM